MKRILVTGANGQLGMTLQELASAYSSKIRFDFKTSQEVDITNLKGLMIVFENGYDYCINCAAYTNVEQSEKKPEKAFSINAMAVKELAKLCSVNKVILVHISTDYVFDGEKEGPYLPSDTPNPINEYGKSKLMGERFIREILKNFYIVRTSWLYSKKYGKNFYRTILEKALRGENLKVTDEQIGCPTNTVSLSKFILDSLILREQTFGTYHFCDEERMTWHGFSKKILLENNILNKISLERSKNQASKVLRPKNSVLAQK